MELIMKIYIYRISPPKKKIGLIWLKKNVLKTIPYFASVPSVYIYIYMCVCIYIYI